MPMKSFPKDVLLALMDGDEPEGYLVVEEGEWEDDGKWQHSTTVFAFEGALYWVSESRSGSYYSDYEYASSHWPDMVECDKVEPYDVTTTKYRRVKA